MAKRIHAEITDEAAQAFKQALKIRDHREAQLADDKHFKGVGLCAICDEYEKLVAIVDTALDVMPWQLSPVDVVDVPAPPMWPAGKQADWDRARDQHVVHARAAKVPPLTKALITDACRGQAAVRWCERHNKIPDGPNIGQPFRLLEFQRNILRDVYGDPAYWRAVDAVLKKRRRSSSIRSGEV
jgi:hypothetical protein